MGDETTPGEVGSLYRFAHAEFDERAHELRVNGRAVAIEAKALSVLACLLGRPAETLTKDELFEAAWPGRVVTEGALTKAVMKLRAVLGDDGQAIIRTVHGFGYRLGVPVERLSSDAPARFLPAPGQTVPSRPNWRLVESLDPDRRGMVWLAEHAKTRDRRVFKFADGADALVTLKREITLYRLLHDSLGAAAPVVQILDWNLDEPPYFTESEWIEGGDLGQWLAGGVDASEDPVGAEAPPAEGEAVGGASAPTAPGLRRDEWVGAEAPSAAANPSLALRLEAIAQTCEAVAATHGVGVVHKDLKPANVLVRTRSDGRLQICLADFGIGALSDARAIEALGITKLGFTRTRSDRDSSSGTPLYLAPEVIGGQMPTQRSDIYALGVMLYQAIVADPRKPLAPGWERDVDDELLREDIADAADVDPERRLGDAAQLARRLRGLSDRRRQRTAAEQSARAQADALRRAEAQARRNRVFAALAVMLLVASVVSFGFYRDARRAQVEAEAALASAEREMAISQAINRFLNEDLIRSADPFTVADPNRPISEVIEEALARVEPQLGDEPAVAGEVFASLGQALSGLGRLDAATTALDAAVERMQRAYGPGDARTLQARLARAMVENAAQRNEAFAELVDILVADAIDLPVLHPTRMRIVNSHAWAPFSKGNFREALQRYSRALDELRAWADAPADELANLYWGQALALLRLGEPMPALEAAQQGLALRTEALGEDAVFTWLSEAQVANALVALDRADEALPRLESVYRRMQGRFGPVHNQSVGAAHEYGLALLNAGRPELAVEPLRDAVRGKTSLFGELSGSAVTSGAVLAAALTHADRLDEADALFLTYRDFQPRSAYDQRSFGSLLRNRAELRLLQGRSNEARDDCEKALDITRAQVPEGHPMLRASEVCLGLALAQLGEADAARALIEPNLPALRAAGRPAARLVGRVEAIQHLLER